MPDEIPVIPCHDCAFTPGTEANLYGWTKLKADLCVIARDPFQCHVGEPRICAGFLRALRDAPEEPTWKCVIAACLLDIMHQREHGEVTDDEAIQMLREAVLRS